MKRISVLLPFSCLLFLSACNFSAGYQKDLRSGLSYKYNGFRVKSVFMVDSADRVMTDNKTGLNSQVSVVALGISGYELKEGKAFPGMMLTVTDKAGVPVINEADLFAGGEGYPPENATELRGDITVARPMRAGETYNVKIHIWDKLKVSNTIDAGVSIVVR